ncbi:hypothetical protein BDQ17DRAFT_1412489 [Cyathus striatus]|nr:hypothetical protein BDQ17DRAFT_1412489 [Cyathus striatus]
MQVANLREEVRQFQDTALPGSRTTLLLQTQINCSVPHAGAVPCGLGFGGDGMELILVRVAVAGQDKVGEQMFQVLMVVPPKGKIRASQEFQLNSTQSSPRIYDICSMFTHELLEDVARIFIAQDQYMAIRLGTLAMRVVGL